MQEKIKKVLNDVFEKKFLKECLIIFIVGIIVNSLCFLMPIVVNAAGVESSYFPFNSGYNENSINVNQSFIDEQLTNGAVFIRCYSDASSSYPNRMRYAVLTDIEQNASTQVRLYGEILSGYGGSSFSLYWDNPNSLISYKVNYYLDWGDGSDITQTSSDSNTLRPFNNISSAIGSNNVYYTKYNINLNSANNIENVLIYAPAEEINVGDFTDLPPLDEILDNLSDTYTPDFSPVYPNIDNNKTDLENQKSFFDTLSQGITQNFNNLGSNLQKFFNKIQQKLTDVSNSISKNIYNGFATLMQNIKDFFGPKLDKIIDLLTEIKEFFTPSDLTLDDVKADFENTSIYSDYESIITLGETFQGTFDISEPSTYSIPIHLENVSILNYNQTEYIDLAVINPVKSLIRAFMWAICTFSIFVTVLDAIPNYINGGGDE